MSEWSVYGSVSIGVCMKVDAETKEEALEKALEQFPGLTNYAGNGGMDQLVGVCDSDCSLEAEYGEPTFTDAEQRS